MTIFLYSFYTFSLTWSLHNYNFRFALLSVGLRERLNSAISLLQSKQSSINISSNTNEQDTNVTNICCFERVVSILKIFIDRSSCLLQNVSLIIQIRRGFLLLNGGMYRELVHIDQ